MQGAGSLAVCCTWLNYTCRKGDSSPPTAGLPTRRRQQHAMLSVAGIRPLTFIMCCAQLIFIGPIGRSYTPQGGNVSPTLVRRAWFKSTRCLCMTRGACQGSRPILQAHAQQLATPKPFAIVAAPLACTAIKGLLVLLSGVGMFCEPCCKVIQTR